MSIAWFGALQIHDDHHDAAMPFTSSKSRLSLQYLRVRNGNLCSFQNSSERSSYSGN